MNLSETNKLCAQIVSSLVGWRALLPALQSGGVERKMSAPIQKALAEFQEFIVLPEYRQIDYALIDNSSDCARIKVDTAIECKFNYASQIGEIYSRLPSAIEQVAGYKKDVNSNHACVIYVIAAPYSKSVPPHPRDSGWGYWNRPLQDAILAVHESSLINGKNRLLSEATHIGDVSLYCALIDATRVN